MRIRKLFRWVCQLATLFLLYDLAGVFWACIQSHRGGWTTWGTCYVGDALWVLYIELFVCVPLAAYWVLWGHRRISID